jgi:hypothetical protein
LRQNTITSIICTLCVLSTIIISFIVYMDVDNSFSFGFILSYVFFIILASLYLIITFIINIKNIKWCNLRKRLFKFIGLSISFSATIYIFNYIFQPSEIDIYDFGTPLAVAFSLTFFDLMFFKNKEG